MLADQFFDAWSQSLPPRGKPKLVLVLESYLDESGIHDESPMCLMAGYVATNRQWTKVIREWEHVQRSFNAPVFHAYRFFPTAAFKQDYPGWDEEKRRSYVMALVGVLRAHKLVRINHGVDVAAFRALTEDERRHVTGGILSKNYSRWTRQGAPTKPYFLCFMLCVNQALNSTSDLKVNLFCDEQPDESSKNNATELVELIKEYRADQERLGSIIFGSRGDHPPLQAADLLAYLWYVQRSKDNSPFEDEILEALLGGQVSLPYCNDAMLKVILEGLPNRVGER
jgi:hypothetical protein